jgi:pimeloyl-ACP methyl ester carboxylesterase
MELEILTRTAGAASERPPLLFVHGSSHAAWCWEEHFLDFFARRGFDAHALSLRGHGRSEGRKLLRWTSVSDYVNDVRSVAVSLPRDPVLIGHSLGGLVVQRYLERFSAAGAVLLASSPVGGMFRPGLRLVLKHPFLCAHVYLSLDPGVLFATPTRARRFLFSPRLSEERVRRYAARLGPESFRAMFDMTYSRPNVHQIRQRGCPMLVVGAADDVLVPPAEVQDTARAYDAPSRMFSSMGHDLMLDDDWEQVAEHVGRWLEETLPNNRDDHNRLEDWRRAKPAG